MKNDVVAPALALAPAFPFSFFPGPCSRPSATRHFTMKTHSAIEPLESRIAPAAVFVTYTDLDGDIVKITATKAGAAVAPLDATDLTFVGGGANGQLASLLLSAPGFDGAKIVFTVTKKPGGDGLAHVGYVNADNVDLDQVIVKGDLGRIDVGDANTAADPGLRLLSVRSMGVFGLVTQGGTGSLISTVSGALGALRVAGNFDGADFKTTGGADGGIGSIAIGGDLRGGAEANSGRIESAGAMGPVKIGGDIRGGTGFQSGQVTSGAAMGAVYLVGDLVGGGGPFSGQLSSVGAMGAVRIDGSLLAGGEFTTGVISSGGALARIQIGGDVLGGISPQSGYIRSGAAMGDVQIGGDVLGGAGDTTGFIGSTGAMGVVKIGGDLVGGSIFGTGSLRDSGSIFSSARIAGVTIGGSLIAGSDVSTGTLTRSGSIVATDDIGPVRIGRDLIGNATHQVLIAAQGQSSKPTSGFDVAIASLTVGGSVHFARVLAGFAADQSPANADASIGAVKVGRDWSASSVVAGAEDIGSDGFGIGDALQTVGDTGLIARIASIAIGGHVTGTPAVGDFHGFVAQRIDSFKSFGFIAPLVLATNTQTIAIPFTNDVRIVEVN